MLPFDKMPYTNFHELNLAYFIVHFREIFAEWETLYNSMVAWREQTDADLTLWKTDTLNAIEDYERDLTDAWDTWKSETALDITDWKNETLNALDAWKTAFQTLFDSTFSNLTQIKTDAEAARDTAITAQHDAETAAASVAASAAQIETNTNDISDLKTIINESNLISTVTPAFEWVDGGINNSGQDRDTPNNIRTDFITIPAASIHFNFNSKYYDDDKLLLLVLFLYDENKVFKSLTGYGIGVYDLEIPAGYYIRFVIKPASGSTSIPTREDANDILQVSYVRIQNVLPDTTLTINGRAADSEAVGEAISKVKNTLFAKSIYTEWERGRISSTGTNAQSSSTVYIRNGYRYKIEKAINHLTVPDNVTVELYGYNGINGSFIEQIGTYTESADITLTPDVYIRMVAYYTDLSDTPLSIGDSVILSYMDDAQNVYDNYNNYKINDFSCLSMFETFGVIGDSWASGSIHVPGTGYVDTVYKMSWPQILAREIGAIATNYSRGGLSTKTWLSDSNGLPALLADTQKQLYIINLGINDNSEIKAGTLTLGTINDINISDYTQNPDTFFGDYGRIIGNIKDHAPKAIIILLSVARPAERNMDAYIEQIATAYNIPFVNLNDDDYFTSGYFYGSIYDGHMSAFGYSGMAKAIQRLIQNYIVKNRLMFAFYDGLTN